MLTRPAAAAQTPAAQTPAAPAAGEAATAVAWVDPPNGCPEWNNNVGYFQVSSHSAALDAVRSHRT